MNPEGGEKISGKSLVKGGWFLCSGREATEALEALGMQRIVKLVWSVEQYVQKGLERTIGRPAQCPNCAKTQSLEAHGYYRRWVSGMAEVGRVVRIRVRRFFVRAAVGP